MAGQATHRAGGAKVISFCNVFFFASLICGLVLLVIDRRKVARMLPKLNSSERWLLLAQASSVFFIGPVGFFLALGYLNVTAQTLLFRLSVPLSAIAAGWLLKEPLLRHFGMILVFILLGVVLAGSGQWRNNLSNQSDLIGVAWALL
jgi:drug/metabolite transporter (DMT)-like permease